MMNGFRLNKSFGQIIFGLIILLISCSYITYAKSKTLLVVSVTKGFKHQSIPILEKVIEELGTKSKSFTVDFARTDEDLLTKMSSTGLKKYDGVVFASTTGDLPLPDREAFLNWIKKGKSFIGVHSATDTFHGFSPFIEMIGGEFSAHGPQLKVTLNVNDENHPAVKVFGKTHEIFDEIYVFKNFNRENVRVLLSLDKNPNKNDKENFEKEGFFPLAWCRKYGKGRVFYTALGHREDVVVSEVFKNHLLGGIQWSLNQIKGDYTPNFSK